VTCRSIGSASVQSEPGTPRPGFGGRRDTRGVSALHGASSHVYSDTHTQPATGAHRNGGRCWRSRRTRARRSAFAVRDAVRLERPTERRSSRVGRVSRRQPAAALQGGTKRRRHRRLRNRSPCWTRHPDEVSVQVHGEADCLALRRHSRTLAQATASSLSGREQADFTRRSRVRGTACQARLLPLRRRCGQALAQSAR
jgi:hypothetical protein